MERGKSELTSLILSRLRNFDLES
ncbi:hypothetical protein CCACVL1_08392 [Corchorus capsularis]|uniref:Uncharacterized protein n=1 Tax=Corchorus capsularis TaxID=210143 RepID=A0A1R3J0X0_COCAP|nr:hypothetical protein CCACVL1_08392 [Corchorus capsularis]